MAQSEEIRLRRFGYFRKILMDTGFARCLTVVGSEAFASALGQVSWQEMQHTTRRARLDS